MKEREGNSGTMVRGRERLGGREILLGAVCWIAYFSIYLGRLNFSAGMSEMLQTGLWEKGQLGSVAAAFYLAYGIGQYPSGLLGDRIPARWMVGTGLLGSALVNILFPAAGTVSGMRGMWFVNGLLQAMIWPPMVRLVTSQVNAGCSVKIILLLSFSSPAGMLCTYLVNAVILQTGSWEWCFLSAGIWLTGVAALWFVLTAAVERTVSPREKEPRQRDAPYKQNKRKRTAAVSSGLLCLTMAAFLHGILKDGLTTWIPTYLTEKFALASSFSALLAMALPVVNLCGIPVAQTANRHLFQNEAVVGAICYLLSLGGFLCMLGGGGNSLYGTVILFAMVTSMMVAVNTVLVSLLPLHFGKEGRVATVSGMMNAVTYLGSAAASVLFGYTMEYAGWTDTQIVWCVCAAAGGLCCIGAIKNWKRNRKDIYGEGTD